MGETMRNIIIFVALLGAAAIFTVLYCLIAAGSQAEKKLTEIMRKEERRKAMVLQVLLLVGRQKERL